LVRNTCISFKGFKLIII
jgi:gliotoxin/aspirochlorine biosynthesis aminotransferase